MPNRDVVGEEPNQDKLDVWARWEELAKWTQNAIAKRLPDYAQNIGVMHGVVDAVQALADANVIPANSGTVAEELWVLQARAAEEPITPQEAADFLNRASSIINRQV